MRLATALGASLALHIAVGFAPPGQLLLAGRAGESPAPGGPAPLWVRLGQNSQSPVQLAASTAGPSKTQPSPRRQQDATAAALANTDEIPAAIDPQGEAPTAKAIGGESGLPEPYYFRPTEVTTPAYIRAGRIALPKELARDIASGRMIIALHINEHGTIDQFVVENNELRNDVKEVIAGQVKDLRFVPAVKDGQPVKSRMRIEITLQPPGPFMPANRASAAGN